MATTITGSVAAGIATNGGVRVPAGIVVTTTTTVVRSATTTIVATDSATIAILTGGATAVTSVVRSGMNGVSIAARSGMSGVSAGMNGARNAAIIVIITTEVALIRA